MDISITVSNRELSPAVCNFFQYENQTVTLKFTLDSYKYGEVDLRNYKAYGVTSQNGMVDMTELVSTYDSANDKLVLTWQVQEYSLRQVGPITYQICFKENANDGENTAVFYSYKGIMINRGSIDGDNHITANYPTLLKQWLDKMNNMAELFDAGVVYMSYGQSIPAAERLSGRLYFQYTDTANTTGQFEDDKGNVLTDPNVMHLIGKETLSGTKINTSQWQAKCTFDSAKLPESNKFENNYVSIDANDELVGYGGMQYLTDGTLSNRLGVHRKVNGEDKFGAILVGLDKDGNPVTEAPTPAADDNSTKIATTAFVKNAITGSPKADVDLSNTGMVSNCILSAPNGLLSAGTERQWYDSWKTLSSSQKEDRSNVKVASTGPKSNQTFTLAQLNGNWDLVIKMKLTATSSGTFKPKDTSVVALSMARLEGDETTYQMLRLGFSDTSGTSETKPFYCNLFPTDSTDTESYRIISNVKPTADTWYWIKLNKTGTTFTYSYSTNGTTYTTLGTLTNVPAFTSAAEEGGFLRLDAVTNAYAYYDLSSNEYNNIFFGDEKTPLVTYTEGFPGPIVAKSGMSVLLPNGIEATTGRLASVGLTLTEDISLAPANEGSYYVCLLSDSTLISIQKDQYFVSEKSPGYEAGRLWYQPSTNTMKGTSVTTSLAKENSILLGEYTYSNGLITAFSAYSPLKITDISNATNKIDYVVERYEDEEGNWYEVWKSGKLRQGGLASSSSTGIQDVTFLKPFAQKPHMTGCTISSDTGWATNQGAALLYSSASLTTTGFTTYLAPAIKKYWTAEGQGA